MRKFDEQARLNALQQLGLLDTLPSESFDRITRMASQLFGLPIAAVSLTDQDRQWFKSRVGVDHQSIPRDRAPCSQVAESTDVLVVNDLLADDCYRDSNLARSGVRFYAGAPLVTRDGYGLGAMCVLGAEPREVTELEIAALSDMAAMVMSQIELQHAFGRVDPLSGLPNRNQFLEDIEDLSVGGERDQEGIVVLVDLATTEQLNQAVRALGPAYLDELVREAASVIRKELGDGRKAYHVASTQFAFLAPPGVAVDGYVAQITALLAQNRAAATSRFVTTVAIGLAPFILGETPPQDVLRIAYSAVQDARDTETKVSLYSPTQDISHRRRFTLLNAFGEALEAQDQLRLVYQPRVNLASGACVGAEALMRWTHPQMGAVSPGEFIPLVEQTAMIRGATAWAIDAALQRLSQWRDASIGLQLSVNVSAANLQEGDFVDRLISGLNRHGVAVDRLELEVTESAVMGDHGQALAVLETLAAAGVSLAIDDFGTGHSSLSYLQRLPTKVVKIDQSFIADCVTDSRRGTLVKTMISLSQNLGYRVVAEGVETAEARDFLANAGCDEAQGYFLGRPMEHVDFVRWLGAWRPAGVVQAA